MLKFKEITKNQVTETVIVLSIALLLLGFYIDDSSFAIAAFATLMSNFILIVGKIITFIWLNFSLYLSKLSNFLLLIIIYFLIFIPYSLLYRYNKKKENKLSTFIKRDVVFSKKDLSKLW